MTTGGPDDRRLGISELEERLGYDRRTIARWVKAGGFPRQHYMRRDRRWWLSEVVVWEAANVSGGRTADKGKGPPVKAL